jgi:uncharacterized membrane protein YhiD involved in acid resistance
MKLDMKNQTLRLVAVFVVVLIGSALLVYALLRGTTTPTPTRPVPASTPDLSGSRPTPAETVPEVQTSPRSGADSLIDRIFESSGGAQDTYVADSFGATLLRITLRLLLAGALGAVLAFRPRKESFALRRNPYVAQTQILLAIVASALMMIVGDNVARAFGIFAAVSLVRFRTNIRDPKEISVLLTCLALGLASGVGRPELAIILCFFVLVVLWILERYEVRLGFRSMQLKVLTKDMVTTQHAVTAVLSGHQFESELRALSRKDDEDTGTIVISVDISPDVTTDLLSQEILSEDTQNITSIEWEQKKTFSNLYQ